MWGERKTGAYSWSEVSLAHPDLAPAIPVCCALLAADNGHPELASSHSGGTKREGGGT